MLKVIIPCFPRSGTSFLTGLIVRMGFNPGPKRKLKKEDRYNPFGYYEFLPLMHTTRELLKKFNGDIVKNIPVLPKDWIDNAVIEKQRIRKIVEFNNIEIYKDAHLIVLADLFDDLFPDAKWIVINRNIEETYRSRFGQKLTFAEWEKITFQRLNYWQQSKPYKKCLKLDYQDFFEDLDGIIEQIRCFLNIKISNNQLQVCKDWFKPKSGKMGSK